MTKFSGEPVSAIGPRTMASERLACRVLGQHRSTQRKAPKGRADDAALTADIVALATEYGRYGYRRIAAMPRAAGWAVNVKRVERRDLVRHWSEDNGRAASGGAQSARQATEEEPFVAE
jgi:HTH-like domain